MDTRRHDFNMRNYHRPFISVAGQLLGLSIHETSARSGFLPGIVIFHEAGYGFIWQLKKWNNDTIMPIIRESWICLPFAGFCGNSCHGSWMLVQTEPCLPLSTHQGMAWNWPNLWVLCQCCACARKAYQVPARQHKSMKKKVTTEFMFTQPVGHKHFN